jgi:hypothetical protein
MMGDATMRAVWVMDKRVNMAPPLPPVGRGGACACKGCDVAGMAAPHA